MNIQKTLKVAFRLLKKVVDHTGVNLIDNYSYREFTVIDQLKTFIPSIKKTIGRTGDDASAEEDGYFHIEKKSGTNRNKTLTVSCFPKMAFDKQSDPARRAYIYTYDGLSLAYFEYYNPYPTALVFVPKEHVSKLHPLFQEKQNAKVIQFNKNIAEGKNIGRDTIEVSLEEIEDKVGKQNLICWLHGERIKGEDFFDQLTNNRIKINQ